MSILRRFTDFLLQNRFQAMGTAFVFAYIPMLGSIAILIAGLVTLRKGALEGLLITIAATLPAVLKYYGFHVSTPDIEWVRFALILTLVSHGLVWLFAVLLKRYNSWSVIIEYAALLGIVIIGMAHLFYPDIQGFWGTQLTNYFNKTSQMMSGTPSLSMDEKQHQLVDVIKVHATGLMIVSIWFNVFLQLLLARWWQAVVFNPGGLRNELHEIRLSHVMGVVLIVAFGISLLKNATVVDMMPVLYMAFCAAGLSLAHYYFFRKKNSWFWLLLMYVLVIWLLLPLGILLVAAVALFDVWMDFRRRLAQKKLD